MTQPPAFGFSGSSIASSYDEMLVPALFEPWALRLVDEHGPWEGRRVLDLATGTGVVAHLLCERVGPTGCVTAADINDEMLALARRRCSDVATTVIFVETPAHLLPVETASMDVVVCQQGFQFFPERQAAAEEVKRVLCPGGRLVATTWLPVEECEFFGIICASLEALGEHDISRKMRVPFDHVADEELSTRFTAAGFVNVVEQLQEADMLFTGGVDHALATAWSTPIGPDLRSLPEAQRAAFDALMRKRLAALTDAGATRARAATRLLTASTPT